MSQAYRGLSAQLVDFYGGYGAASPPRALSINPMYVVAVLAYQPKEREEQRYQSEIAFDRYVLFVTTDVDTTRALLRGHPPGDPAGQPETTDTSDLFAHQPTEAA